MVGLASHLAIHQYPAQHAAAGPLSPLRVHSTRTSLLLDGRGRWLLVALHTGVQARDSVLGAVGTVGAEWRRDLW